MAADVYRYEDALLKIGRQLEGINKEDLTTAEENILRIVKSTLNSVERAKSLRSQPKGWMEE